jgi:hypothetical protein
MKNSLEQAALLLKQYDYKRFASSLRYEKLAENQSLARLS